MTSRLVVITLPRGDWSAKPQFSLFLSFHVEAGAGSAVLSDIAFLRRWPITVRSLAFSAHLRAGASTRRIGRLTVKGLTGDGQAETVRWRAMVADDTPLGAQPRAGRFKSIRGYDFRTLCDAVDTYYDVWRPSANRSKRTGNELDGLGWWGTNEMLNPNGVNPQAYSVFHDFAQYHLPNDPIHAAAVTTPDVNQRISEIAQYPALMRALGFVVDVELDLDAGETLPSRGEIATAMSPGGLATSIQVVSPWSAYETARSGGRPFGVMTPAKDDGVRRQGFYTLPADRIRLIQYPLDSTLGRIMVAAKARKEAFAQKTAPGYVAAGPPAASSSGFSLYHTQIIEDLTAAQGRQTQLEAETAAVASGTIDPAAPLLYARDVERGYRVDVEWAGGWHSLSARRHNLIVGNQVQALDPANGSSEGVTSLALASGADGSNKTSQRLFGWIGWSLVVAKPENPVGVEGDPHEPPPPAAPWRVEDIILPGSLPRLRYGQAYSFRCRSTDLAGNSWTLAAATDAMRDLKEAATPPQVFQRLDPVGAPTLTQDEPLIAGEKVALLAVRGGTERSRRGVHPPMASFDQAERHGALDGWDDDDAYAVLQVATTRPDERIKEGPFAPYIGDPMAHGIRAEVEPLGPETEAELVFPSALLRRPDAGLVLELRKGDFRVERRRRRLIISLPEGESRRVRLRSQVRPEDRRLFVFDDPQSTQPPDQVTPPVDVTLVHAVPIPLEPPSYGSPAIRERARSQTTAAFTDPELRLHTATTSRVTFEARWSDVFDDPTDPGWSRHDRAAVIAAQEIELPPEHPLAFTRAREFPRRASLEARAERALVVNQAGLFGAADAPKDRFDFQDTHSRVLEITPKGHTRHAEFFPEQAKMNPPPAAIGQPVRLQLLSTANPTTPTPVLILPTFGRKRKQRHGTITQTRTGWSLRLYLKRDWRADETLAIVFGKDAAATDYSALGLDPITASKAQPPPLATSDVHRATIAPDLWLPLSDKYFEKGNSSFATKVDVATLPVQYDAAKDLRFAEIVLQPRKGAFEPFVRLVLARYNVHSISGAELSLPAIAQWAQPAADRSITLIRNGDGSRTLTVLCDAADETPGGSRTRFFAHVEYTELYFEDEYAWNLVPGSEVELRQTAAVPEPTWQVTLTPRHPTLLGRRRIVVREYLELPTGPCIPAEGRRLIAFDIVDL